MTEHVEAKPVEAKPVEAKPVEAKPMDKRERERDVNRRLPFLTVLAAALAILGLGLPWAYTEGLRSSFIPGWFVPGVCYQGYDGYYTCDPGTFGPSWITPGTNGFTTSGAGHPGRFGLIFALVMVAATFRTGRRQFLLYGGIGLGVVNGLSTHLGGAYSGVFCAWSASALLVWAGLGRRPNIRVPRFSHSGTS